MVRRRLSAIPPFRFGGLYFNDPGFVFRRRAAISPTLACWLWKSEFESDIGRPEIQQAECSCKLVHTSYIYPAVQEVTRKKGDPAETGQGQLLPVRG